MPEGNCAVWVIAVGMDALSVCHSDLKISF